MSKVSEVAKAAKVASPVSQGATVDSNLPRQCPSIPNAPTSLKYKHLLLVEVVEFAKVVEVAKVIKVAKVVAVVEVAKVVNIVNFVKVPQVCEAPRFDFNLPLHRVPIQNTSMFVKYEPLLRNYSKQMSSYIVKRCCFTSALILSSNRCPRTPEFLKTTQSASASMNRRDDPSVLQVKIYRHQTHTQHFPISQQSLCDAFISVSKWHDVIADRDVSILIDFVSVQSDQEPLLKALLEEVEDWLENVCSCSSIDGLDATFLNLIKSTTEPNFLMPGRSENRSFLGLYSGYCSSSSASDIQNTYRPRSSKALICQRSTAQFKSHSVLEIRLNGSPVAFELFYVRAKTGRLQPRLESIYKWLKGFPATPDLLTTIRYIIPLNKRVKLSLPSSDPPVMSSTTPP
ncbi:hypothetical protein F4604DRAFT_1932927 [Suillus subluteus]|nr:hypothetical protein F4604DRAFT_1932927 [Suillus subluteus]